MKKVHVYYTFHYGRGDIRANEADFSFDAEDAVADELLEVSTPFYFDDFRRTRRQMHLAEIAYCHAIMHDYYILKIDKILKVSPE
nr:MAG TPA: hypothetical protein [Caudoviricetes sp.]